jgi:hypothetical protein
VITFTIGRFTVTVDDADADLTGETWFVSRGEYVVNNGSGAYSWQRLHRVIMARVLGRSLGRWELVDHIDCDPLNNRRSNLRLCNSSENGFNRDRPAHNKTGYKGVSWNTYRDGPKPYQAAIVVNRRKIYLGSYADPCEAARAYDEAARRYAGQFARGSR